MSMSEEPLKKRPWFQLNLSTCVVLMFVAGVLVWANLQPTHTKWYHGWVAWGTDAEYGWPMIAIRNRQITMGNEMGKIADGASYLPMALSINIALCAMVLTLTAIACEYLIRRQKRRAIPAFINQDT